MVSLVSAEIERYCVEHTTPIPEYLDELTRVTHKSMGVPEMLSGPIEGSLLQFLVGIGRDAGPGDRHVHGIQRPHDGRGPARGRDSDHV